MKTLKTRFASTVPVLMAAVCLCASAASGATYYFQAQADQSYIITGGNTGTISQATAIGDFVLDYDAANPSAATMSYSIKFNGIDLDGLQTPSILDNVTGVHLHDVTMCTPNPACIPGDTALTAHVLNIEGFPRRDDSQIMVDAANSLITGVWDDGDENLTAPAPTVKLSAPGVIDQLFAGNVALMIHTNEVPGGAIGGQLVQVPEPGTLSLLAVATLSIFGRFLRRNS